MAVTTNMTEPAPQTPDAADETPDTADATHPALDDPRAGTTDLQNRIDLNDPTRPGAEVVAETTRVN